MGGAEQAAIERLTAALDVQTRRTNALQTERVALIVAAGQARANVPSLTPAICGVAIDCVVLCVNAST